ncbi:MAG: GNAT family N-acetyltransferase [Acidimicrobiales bacterium]
MTIRPARVEQGTALQEIERLAGARFRDVGMDAVADAAPASLEALGRYARAGRAWVAADEGCSPVGYILVDVVDGNAHVEQVSVRPDKQGRGLGRALLDRVWVWAADRGKPAITLTTFTDVPWNRPLYERLGFSVLQETEIGPELSARRDAETGHGLDPTTRVCMRRAVDGEM